MSNKKKVKNQEEVIDEEIMTEEENAVLISKKDFDELDEKYQKVENSYQRLLADFENYKRRSVKEILDAETSGKVEVLKQIVDIADNFDRSMKFDVQTEEFKKGIEMLHSMFGEKLANVGLEEVEAEGELNPDIHQAIGIDNKDDIEDDHITEVLQKGYMVGEKLIRPAMVKVNKKPEKSDKK